MRLVDGHGQSLDGRSNAHGSKSLGRGQHIHDLCRCASDGRQSGLTGMAGHKACPESGFGQVTVQNCLTQGNGIKDDAGMLKNFVFRSDMKAPSGIRPSRLFSVADSVSAMWVTVCSCRPTPFRPQG
ncbi:hypothetical protein [Xanthomonas sp. NCPPB 2632]|uniref:hypothetical protein n=1 Tax=Xanthomonas sp. NCPPB 2632 TaxID=3240912 RepID=UPI0035182833